MTTVLTLLLGSAIVGLMIGPRYNVYVYACSALVLALVAATVVWLSDFGLLPGILITYACLIVSQIAYLVITWLSMTEDDRLAHHQSDDQVSENGQYRIPNEQTNQEHPPAALTRWGKPHDPR
jgi:prepilin signal peptidase PulO-like enzyme (type II secretory pathway)